MVAHLQHLWRRLREKPSRKRQLIRIALGVLAVGLVMVGLARLAASPARRAGPWLALDAYGAPGVEIRLVYPTHLSPREDRAHPAFLTLYARADAPTAHAVELLFPAPVESILWVDAAGNAVPGRLRAVPGHPDALPYELRLAHAETHQRGGLLGQRLAITPMLVQDGEAKPLPALTFNLTLEGRAAGSWRRLAWALGETIPYLILALLLGCLALAGRELQRRRRLAQEQQLATLYGQLREQIALERWADARAHIERLRRLRAHYRDLDALDTLVSAAEKAAWRREQLYRLGLQAYQQRDWPAAVQALSAVEQETPYYRDVRFLRRTAALYADLASRDRSRRLAAARELGEVGDLVEMTPLLAALGDPSPEVAQAAEHAFRQIGPAAVETLLAGLGHENPEVQRRAGALVEGFGQGAREALLGALRSSDPRITRQAARLLLRLGARQELADALLWATAEHQEGLVAALLSEPVASSGVLIATLLRAPAERQEVVLNALAALKTQAQIEPRLHEALRGATDPAHKELLQRALRLPAAPFRPVEPAISAAAVTLPARGQEARSARMHLFAKGPGPQG